MFFDLRTTNIPKYESKDKHEYLGAGAYGVVISDGENVVRKFAKDAKDSITPYEFPWEYCVAFVTNSPYIAHVIPGSNLKKNCKITLIFQV
jgi:hypothetical protein